MFWMDYNRDQLYRSWLNGSEPTILVSTGIQCSGKVNILASYSYSPSYFHSEGLAWDWVNEKFYWTDHCQDEIEVYDPSTQNRRMLIRTGTNPFSIIVDPGTG